MLSKLVVKWLEWIIEIGIWLSVVGAFVAGVRMGDGFFGSLVSGIFFMVVSGVFCALIFGAFIVLMDIRTLLKRAVDGQSVGSGDN